MTMGRYLGADWYLDIVATAVTITAALYGDALPTSQAQDGGSMTLTLAAGAVDTERELTINDGTDDILKINVSGEIQ